MKKAFLSVSSALLMVLNSVSVGTIGVSAEETNSDTVKILPLGDSITDGYWTSGGYRKYLYNELQTMGYTNIDMVGAKGSEGMTFDYNGQTVTYDDNHSGYSGYAIQKMTTKEQREGILETIQGTWYDGKNMIQAYNPDVVLLQIGTNDVLSEYNDGITDRLENLVNVILADMTDPTDVLYVSTIPDIDAILRADWLGAYGINAWTSTDEEKQQLKETVQNCIDTYNQSIYDMVAEMQSEGKNIRFADINSVVDYTTDLYDGVHPNEQGYENMGKYWADLLDSTYLNGDNDTPTETTTETTTTTTTTTELLTTTTSETTVTTTESTEITTETTTTEEEIPVVSYDVADAVKLAQYLILEVEISESEAKEFTEYFDIDKDETINVFDLVLLKRIIKNNQ